MSSRHVQTDLQGARDDERAEMRESFRYFERAPVGVVVVRGDAHTVVYANTAFRELSGLDGSALVGQAIGGIIENPAVDAFHQSPTPELIALLDRVRSEQVAARDANISGTVRQNATVDAGVGIGSQGVWRCTVWPVRERGIETDQLVIEMRHAQEGESSLARQRDIAERMLLSALREQTLAEDNTRLYGLADRARVVAEEARLLAERQKVRAEEARREAEAANSAKAQFLANMSHELRTPLNAIGGYAQLMEMGLRGPVTDEQTQDLQRIQVSQAHLLGLINAILNYAKLEAGRVVYVMEDVALRDVMAEVESLVSPQLRSKGLRYHYTQCPDVADASIMRPVRVKADAEKLRQVFINLLTNAIKFTADGGQINVECSTENATVTLRVSDTGRGIPANQLKTIFDPFVQIGRRLTSGDTGVGLGLAISRDLALGMNGDLTVESVENEGSTFILVLPAAG
ncbi:MAG: PAS domain-containing sensor histidine kinase [Gemmatimonadaceae bacterium]